MRILAVAFVLLSALVVTGTPATAAQRWLELVPASGPHGATVTVYGHGFEYQHCVAHATLYWDGYGEPQVVSLAEDDSDPSFVATMTVPDDYEQPGFLLRSLCGHGELSEPGPTVQYTVEYPEVTGEPIELATVVLEPATGEPGSTVGVSGSGYAGCEYVALRWADRGGEDVIPDTGGDFRTQLEVPADKDPGELELHAGCEDGEVIASALFTVDEAQPDTSTSDTQRSDPTGPGDEGAGGGGQNENVEGGQGGGARGGDGDEGGGATVRNTGTSGDLRPHPVLMTSTLPTAADLDTSPAVLLLAALLAALLILLIAFPAELFNKTYDENRAEIHRILRIRRDRLPGWLGLLLFVGLGAVLSAMLAGGEGAAGNPLAQVIGFLVAIPVVTFAYGLPAELYARGRSRVDGVLQVLPPALLVAVVCAGISMLLSLEPPYLYGLFAGFVALRLRTLSSEAQGKATLAGVLCLLVCAVLAWLAWSPVHAAAHGESPTWPAVIADAVLFWIVVLATESLVFALPPLRFLDGRKLRDWHLLSWLVPQVVAVAAFAYVFVLRGQLNPPEGGVATVLKALAFFAVFGALSVAIWSYFRWPNRPTRREGTPAVSPVAG